MLVEKISKSFSSGNTFIMRYCTIVFITVTTPYLHSVLTTGDESDKIFHEIYLLHIHVNSAMQAYYAQALASLMLTHVDSVLFPRTAYTLFTLQTYTVNQETFIQDFFCIFNFHGF